MRCIVDCNGVDASTLFFSKFSNAEDACGVASPYHQTMPPSNLRVLCERAHLPKARQVEFKVTIIALPFAVNSYQLGHSSSPTYGSTGLRRRKKIVVFACFRNYSFSSVPIRSYSFLFVSIIRHAALLFVIIICFHSSFSLFLAIIRCFSLLSCSIRCCAFLFALMCFINYHLSFYFVARQHRIEADNHEY